MFIWKKYHFLLKVSHYRLNVINNCLSVTIIQVNLTLPNETFKETLYNPTTNDYLKLTGDLIHEVRDTPF